MRYIHGGTLKCKIPGGAIVRVVFGGIFAVVSLVLMGSSVGDGDLMGATIACAVTFWPGAFLFLFFGIRSLCRAAKPFPRHNPAVMLPMDFNNPLFTTRCERCGLFFDYQQSDLGFRPWYPSGYAECPRCNQPIRHNANVNVFHVEEILYQ